MVSKAKIRVEGARIYLRVLRPNDVGQSYVGWMKDPLVTRYLEARFGKQTRESIRRFVAAMGRDPSQFLFGIFLKEDDRHIGNIKLGPIDFTHRFATVGLLLGARDCWGRGYATEAIGLVKRFAFRRLRLHRLTAGCYRPNRGSEKAFLNAGFEVEGALRKHYRCGNRYVDGILLGAVATRSNVARRRA